MVESVKVTIELGPFSSRQVRLLTELNGGTLTSAAKAMIDLGCSVAGERIDDMSRATMPPDQTDVRLWQDTLLAGKQDELST